MEVESPLVLPPPKNYREYNNVKSNNKLLILTLKIGQEVETMIKENQISSDKIGKTLYR